MSCENNCEDRKQKEGKRRFNGKLGVNAQYAGETERERERENTEKLYSKTLTQYTILHVCVFNAHVLYKSLQGLTEVLSYFNALKERLH